MRLLSLLALAVLAAACGGGDTPAADAPKRAAAGAVADGCAAADTSPTVAAVLEYISTVTPTPNRFLTAAGSDSAVPDDALTLLQDKGPTFFYAGSDAAIAKLKEKLERDGPWPSLLVLFRGTASQPDGTVQVRLGGRYVANADDGRAADERTYTVRCVDGAWRVDGASADKLKPKRDSAPPGA